MIAIAFCVQMIKPLFGFIKVRAMAFQDPPHDQTMALHGTEPLVLAVIYFLVCRFPYEVFKLGRALPDRQCHDRIVVFAHRIAAIAIPLLVEQAPDKARCPFGQTIDPRHIIDEAPGRIGTRVNLPLGYVEFSQMHGTTYNNATMAMMASTTFTPHDAT